MIDENTITDLGPSESRRSTRVKDIPEFPYYVAVTDMFFSGWGPAEDKSNRHIILCTNYDQAYDLRRIAEARQEWTRVKLLKNKPAQRSGVLYSWQLPWHNYKKDEALLNDIQ